METAKTRAAKTFGSAQEAFAKDENVIYTAIYVFPIRYRWELTVQGFDSLDVVYADRTAERVLYFRKSYPVIERMIGCGAHTVKCIFLEGK